MMLRALPYLAAVGMAIAAYHFGAHVEHLARVAEVTSLKRAHSQDLEDIDRANRQALADALRRQREIEAQHAADMAALDAKYTKELQDAKATSDADIAAVRAGAYRLRERFTCPSAGAGSPGGGATQAGPGASVDHAATQRGLGQEDAAAVIAAADEGDRWAVQLRACQAIVHKDRGQ